MTDLRFFNPATGEGLYRVPDGARIEGGEPFGFITGDGNYEWWPEGIAMARDIGPDHLPHFTPAKLAPPRPLPTEEGTLILAKLDYEDHDELMERVGHGWTVRTGKAAGYRVMDWDNARIYSWEEVAITPKAGDARRDRAVDEWMALLLEGPY